MSDMTERNCNKCIHHTSGMCDSWNCKMQTVEDVKKEAVNEYVKAVVDELETNKQNALEVEESIKEYNVWNKAIEIVKRGGVSDDACEWTKINEEGYKNCKCNYDETMPDFFKYCPYCGKKIKVVD